MYKNELVVIATKENTSGSWRARYNTYVEIYDITTREKPKLQKSYELYEPYYTSRCIDNMLYVISNGYLREENDKVVRGYKEDDIEQEIALNDIKYLKDVKTDTQTLISVVDLNNPSEKIKLNSYLIDVSNAYVSENSIYLLKEDYESANLPIKAIFGLKGLWGLKDYIDSDYEEETEIYKFDIEKNGEITYKAKTKVEGETVDQYSLDEYNGHLRVALYDYKGTRVEILDDKLQRIGETERLAKGEKMYSSRFIGNKVYLVTYKTVDPLFVIDLSNEKAPQVLGKLKIPGYSAYLHPYDENHLIGIGMETKEVVNRNSSGKVVSTSASIVGMKMALFDVTDVNNPEQISQTIIGDSRTTSAILTNPKALLFSKEKELIAIPVNNYSEDFNINSDAENYSSSISSYRSYSKPYVAEGYFVYNINLEDGFELKGTIKHDKTQKNLYNTKLLRGLYIDDNLYTVSEEAVKVHKLDTLDLVDEIKID